MSGSATKFAIKVESPSTQQEHLKHSRKTLKVIQKTADKENLIGRKLLSGKEQLLKTEQTTSENLNSKRKKLITQSVQTDEVQKSKAKITEEDLTTEQNPSEAYWEILAEQRRVALEDTLEENHNLHDKVEKLKAELNSSKQMIEEARNLVGVLTELLKEKDDDNLD